MTDTSRKDIRRILKTFGIRADEAMVAHLARNPNVEELSVRVTLEDVTAYGDITPEGKLYIVLDDSVRRTPEDDE